MHPPVDKYRDGIQTRFRTLVPAAKALGEEEAGEHPALCPQL